MMNSRGLEYEAWLVHFKGLKVKVSGLRILFVEVCEWFAELDRLNIIFRSRKNNIMKLCFMLNMIKNYHYISLICCKKNINMYKWN